MARFLERPFLPKLRMAETFPATAWISNDSFDRLQTFSLYQAPPGSREVANSLRLKAAVVPPHFARSFTCTRVKKLATARGKHPREQRRKARLAGFFMRGPFAA